MMDVWPDAFSNIMQMKTKGCHELCSVVSMETNSFQIWHHSYCLSEAFSKSREGFLHRHALTNFLFHQVIGFDKAR